MYNHMHNMCMCFHNIPIVYVFNMLHVLFLVTCDVLYMSLRTLSRTLRPWEKRALCEWPRMCVA